jgi:hypothetical protein
MRATTHEIFSLSKNLSLAAERQDEKVIDNSCESLLALFQGNPHHIPLAFEKVYGGRIAHPLNALFYLAKAVDDASCRNDAAITDKIIHLICVIISGCNDDFCIRHFFEATPTITRPQAVVLRFLLQASKRIAGIEETIFFVLIEKLGSLPKNHYDDCFFTMLLHSYSILLPCIKNYCQRQTNIEKLATLTHKDTLLGSVIDYHFDAVSAIKEYSLRGFVERYVLGTHEYNQREGCWR